MGVRDTGGIEARLDLWTMVVLPVLLDRRPSTRIHFDLSCYSVSPEFAWSPGPLR